MDYWQFSGQFDGLTSPQARAKRKLYQEEWLQLSGTVMDVDGPGPDGYYYASIRTEDVKRHLMSAEVLCFDENITDIPKGQKIVALCQIDVPDKFGLRIQYSKCELQGAKQ